MNFKWLGRMKQLVGSGGGSGGGGGGGASGRRLVAFFLGVSGCRRFRMDGKMAGRVLLSVSSRTITGHYKLLSNVCFGAYDPFGCYLVVKIERRQPMVLVSAMALPLEGVQVIGKTISERKVPNEDEQRGIGSRINLPTIFTIQYRPWREIRVGGNCRHVSFTRWHPIPLVATHSPFRSCSSIAHFPIMKREPTCKTIQAPCCTTSS